MTNKISLAIEQGQKPSIGRRSSNEPLNAFLVYTSDSEESKEVENEKLAPIDTVAVTVPGEHKDEHGDKDYEFNDDYDNDAYNYSGNLRRTVSVPDMNTHPPKKRTFSICDLDDDVSPISPLNDSTRHPRRNSVALKFQSPKLLT
ncbi:hypothetical protein CLIB1444_12S01992 [[Candida] jaroonii]|uniref:Uncharacterized protein n=1 Tax=[Candida] jaroonii TaxID=467808 RepID=A0ACA9YD68_9ASCO|nr:hypothetical protein CLIB1444_12S01992 [[Candida] jaroonii]